MMIRFIFRSKMPSAGSKCLFMWQSIALPNHHKDITERVVKLKRTYGEELSNPHSKVEVTCALYSGNRQLTAYTKAESGVFTMGLIKIYAWICVCSTQNNDTLAFMVDRWNPDG